MALSNKLTNRMLKAELAKVHSTPKVLSDGDGLYLRIRPGGTIASWFFAAKVRGARRELGLGSIGAVDLDLARELAGDVRKAIAQGRDPFAEKAAAKREVKEATKVLTFGAFAEDYIASVEAGFRNAKHVAQWRSTLTTYAAHLSKLRLDEITTDDVLKVLRPIWTTKPETASRVRGRIEKILSAAKAKNLRPRDSFNVATWRGHLDILLPRQPKESRGHHGALPFGDAPEFMAKLRSRPALAARALEFTILTAARTGETIGARWGEIDEKAAIWTVPPSRMKAKVEHRVPLSPAALALLKRLRPKEPQPDDLIFTAGENRAGSNMMMAMLLRRMGCNEFTVHGMRSTFRDWAGEATEFPRELAEQALAHTLQSKAERAYRRQTAVERRRALMEAWANFLDGATAQVVEMPERARGPKLTPAAA
jgi:integrase